MDTILDTNRLVNYSYRYIGARIIKAIANTKGAISETDKDTILLISDF